MPMRPCLDCGQPSSGTRCPTHTRARDAARGTRQARGYDATHDQARGQLAATLPAPCGYCHATIHPTEPWNAAHVVDGHPEYGYVVAHPRCNQQARASNHTTT